MTGTPFYRPYHDRDCPARTEEGTALAPVSCTCGGRDHPLYDEGLRGKAGKLAHRMWTTVLGWLR